MAERYRGTVLRVELGGDMSAEDVRILDRLLDTMDGVVSHAIDVDNNTLTAYLDEDEAFEAENALVSAIIHSGMYPMGFSEMGFIYKDGRNAC